MHVHNRRMLSNVIFALLAGLFLATVVLFSWNSFAPDLFQLPAMQFKQALGLVLFIFSVAFLVRFDRKRIRLH